MTLPAATQLDPGKTRALWQISRRYCGEEGGSHGPDHTERVYHLALAIGRRMGARLDILAAAALLHDIGRRHETESRGTICHAAKGADLAEPVLAGLGFSRPDIEAVTHCIRAHRFRGRERPRSTEAEILFDADKLDSIGAVGIGRAFLFAGQIGARLHDAEIDHMHTRSYSTDDTAYREFRVKMSRVREQLLTEPGRRLAERRHRFMEIFFDELNLEIYGSELDR